MATSPPLFTEEARRTEIARLFGSNPSPCKGDGGPEMPPEAVWRRLHAAPGPATQKAAGSGAGKLKGAPPKDERPLLVVDSRAVPEMAMSMIPGAVTLEAFEKNKEKFRKHSVVFYCTVGYRSGLLAEAYRKEGFDACHMEAALLGWVGRGLPLVDPRSGKPTNRVHTCGPRWNLVPPGYVATWSDLPADEIAAAGGTLGGSLGNGSPGSGSEPREGFGVFSDDSDILRAGGGPGTRSDVPAGSGPGFARLFGKLPWAAAAGAAAGLAFVAAAAAMVAELFGQLDEGASLAALFLAKNTGGGRGAGSGGGGSGGGGGGGAGGAGSINRYLF